MLNFLLCTSYKKCLFSKPWIFHVSTKVLHFKHSIHISQNNHYFKKTFWIDNPNQMSRATKKDDDHQMYVLKSVFRVSIVRKSFPYKHFYRHFRFQFPKQNKSRACLRFGCYRPTDPYLAFRKCDVTFFTFSELHVIGYNRYFHSVAI